MNIDSTSNRIFPEWFEANKILNQMVDQFYGPHAFELPYKPNRIYITLFDISAFDELTDLISDEHTNQIKAIVESFSEKVFIDANIDIKKLEERYSYSFIDEQIKRELYNYINLRLKQAETIYKYQYRDILKGCLGINPYYLNTPHKFKNISFKAFDQKMKSVTTNLDSIIDKYGKEIGQWLFNVLSNTIKVVTENRVQTVTHHRIYELGNEEDKFIYERIAEEARDDETVVYEIGVVHPSTGRYFMLGFNYKKEGRT